MKVKENGLDDDADFSFLVKESISSIYATGINGAASYFRSPIREASLYEVSQ